MPSWKETVISKRAQRENAIATWADAYEESFHGPYLRATASEIVDHIAKGEWKAVNFIDAYIARAAFAHKVTNCLTEVLFEDARKQAVLLDSEYSATNKLRGVLHGVPVSFKDQYQIPGYDTTIGFTNRAGKPSTIESDLVAQLRAAGAIIIVKTNVPQTMLAFECSNPLWGRTLNPWSKDYTCGGSSGGEAAVLALDGSALGVGSDIGGSLRIPTSYCGVYALKPGAGRVSTGGAASPTPGAHGIDSVVGPMGRSVADLEVFCRLTFGVSDTIRAIAPIPYRDVKLGPKQKFGYYTSDGFVKASPACKRAVVETVEALRKSGHECVEFEVPKPSEALECFLGLTANDGYKQLISHLGPDPKEKAMFLVTLAPRLPSFIRNVAAWFIEKVVGDSIFAACLREAKPRSAVSYRDMNYRKSLYIAEWNKEIWDKNGFDGIIAPVQALPAMFHDGCANLSPIASSTILFNTVDSPVGVIPVTRVDPSIDQLTDEWMSGPGLGSKILEGRLYRGSDPAYNPKKMAGIPVGVQIVGRKWEDEKVISLMHIVDDALGPRGFGAGSSLGNDLVAV